MARKVKLFFATDVHGSERCFRKVLNAGAAYRPDVMVLGGDVAVAGACPPGGWTVRLSDDANDTDPDLPSVRIRSGGLATSSTAVRHWRRGGIALHTAPRPTRVTR